IPEDREASGFDDRSLGHDASTEVQGPSPFSYLPARGGPRTLTPLLTTDGSLPQQLGVVWSRLLEADSEGPSFISHAACARSVSSSRTFLSCACGAPSMPQRKPSSKAVWTDGVCDRAIIHGSGCPASWTIATWVRTRVSVSSMSLSRCSPRAKQAASVVSPPASTTSRSCLSRSRQSQPCARHHAINAGEP